MKEKHLASEYIYKGNILNLRKDTVQTLNGVAEREIIEHSPAAVILPYEAPDKIYLIKQYRPALEKAIFEAPAGFINKDEIPLDAAKRELKEETGFDALNWTFLGEAYSSPGFCNEYMYYYLAQGLTQSEPCMDEHENIDTVMVSLNEVGRLIEEKEIVDMKTILIYLLMKGKLNLK